VQFSGEPIEPRSTSTSQIGQNQPLATCKGRVGAIRWTQRFINEFSPALVFAHCCSQHIAIENNQR
jgi:hypothetical protein